MRLLRHLAVFFLVWGLGVSLAAFFVPAPWGLLLALAIAAWLVFGYLLRAGGRTPEERRDRLRLHPLDPATRRWSLLALPVMLLLSWALGQVYLQLVPVPEESLNPFARVLESPAGRLSVAVLAIGFAPVVEEFFFRGLLQRGLERRYGARWGVVAAAALFAAVHFLPWVFPIHFVLGLAFGFAVHATRSIWSGVLLHAGNNTLAVAGALAEGGDTPPVPTVWEAGPSLEWWGSVAALLVAGALAAWVARRLWAAGREARLRHA